MFQEGDLPLFCASEKHVSPFCATIILLQLLARPLWVGIVEEEVVEVAATDVFIIVADVVDTPT